MCDPKEDAAVSWKNYDFKEEVLAWANQASKRGVSHYPYSLQSFGCVFMPYLLKVEIKSFQ